MQPPDPLRRRLSTVIGLTLVLAGCRAAPVAAPTTAASPTPIRLGPTSTSRPTASPAATAVPATATAVPIPPVGPGDVRLGPPGAPVQLLVYADFQSRTSAQGLALLLEVFDRHPEEIELVFRHFPVVAEFDKDSLAGQAVEAAGRQGRFWDMARRLTARHGEWSVLPPAGFRDWLYEQAPDLGLDVTEFRADLDGGRYAAYLADAFQRATETGIPGVPTIFLNRIPFRLAPTSLNLESAVRLELIRSLQYSEEPAFDLDPQAGYTAIVQTSVGDLAIQLLPGSAPRAVNSFVFLAMQGWFNSTQFYRVEPGFLVEAGDPSGTGFGDPGYHLPDEIDPSVSFDRPGLLALSSAGPGTGGSRFLITLRPAPEWDGTRTVFGRVIDGLDRLNNLPARDPALDLLRPGAVIIRRVRIEVTR